MMSDVAWWKNRAVDDDHPTTLTSANNFSADLRALGEKQQAGEVEDWIKGLGKA